VTAPPGVAREAGVAGVAGAAIAPDGVPTGAEARVADGAVVVAGNVAAVGEPLTVEVAAAPLDGEAAATVVRVVAAADVVAAVVIGGTVLVALGAAPQAPRTAWY
jgi:hypothetical protein